MRNCVVRLERLEGYEKYVVVKKETEEDEDENQPNHLFAADLTKVKKEPAESDHCCCVEETQIKVKSEINVGLRENLDLVVETREESTQSPNTTDDIEEHEEKCGICSLVLTNKDSLQKHLCSHVSMRLKLTKPFKCNQCNFATSTQSGLKMHMSRIHHVINPPHKCDVCGFSTRNKSKYTCHIRSHTGEKPHKCTLCEFAAAQRSDLTKHLMVHTGEKPFKCDKCEYAGQRPGQLRYHNLIKHGTKDREKLYKCGECDYTTDLIGNLHSHERTHTEDKPYKCKECDYATSYSLSLRIHLSTNHGIGNVKEFACDKCKYTTYKKSNYDKHKLIHTGAAPFKCDKCDYVSVQKCNLKQHLKRHH